MKKLFGCVTTLLLLLLLFGCFQFLPAHGFSENKRLNTSLAQQVDRNPTLYWRQLADTWLAYVQSESSSVWNHWKQVKKESNQVENVSKGCLDIVEHMMQHPIGEEWTAKSKSSVFLKRFKIV